MMTLQEQQLEREYKVIYSLIQKDYGSVAQEFTEHIMNNYSYRKMSLGDILGLASDLQICDHCGEVTESEFMHNGEWDDDMCEWCYGNK
jgi:hypothetical protein